LKEGRVKKEKGKNGEVRIFLPLLSIPPFLLFSVSPY